MPLRWIRCNVLLISFVLSITSVAAEDCIDTTGAMSNAELLEQRRNATTLASAPGDGSAAASDATEDNSEPNSGGGPREGETCTCEEAECDLLEQPYCAFGTCSATALVCDVSCETCDGSRPRDCVTCAENYEMSESGACVVVSLGSYSVLDVVSSETVVLIVAVATLVPIALTCAYAAYLYRQDRRVEEERRQWEAAYLEKKRQKQERRATKKALNRAKRLEDEHQRLARAQSLTQSAVKKAHVALDMK